LIWRHLAFRVTALIGNYVETESTSKLCWLCIAILDRRPTVNSHIPQKARLTWAHDTRLQRLSPLLLTTNNSNKSGHPTVMSSIPPTTSCVFTIPPLRCHFTSCNQMSSPRKKSIFMASAQTRESQLPHHRARGLLRSSDSAQATKTRCQRRKRWISSLSFRNDLHLSAGK